MRFGLHMPNFDAFADPRTLIELARDAEAAGWDGFFLWDHLQFEAPVPVGDPWVLLAGVAANTTRLRLGPLVTPVPRRHIGKLAREAVTLDHLSSGRVILGVGIGGDWFKEYSAFGMATDDKLHATQLDEALAALDRLLRGEPVAIDGSHYHVHTHFLPRRRHRRALCRSRSHLVAGSPERLSRIICRFTRAHPARSAAFGVSVCTVCHATEAMMLPMSSAYSGTGRRIGMPAPTLKQNTALGHCMGAINRAQRPTRCASRPASPPTDTQVAGDWRPMGQSDEQSHTLAAPCRSATSYDDMW